MEYTVKTLAQLAGVTLKEAVDLLKGAIDTQVK